MVVKITADQLVAAFADVALDQEIAVIGEAIFAFHYAFLAEFSLHPDAADRFLAFWHELANEAECVVTTIN